MMENTNKNAEDMEKTEKIRRMKGKLARLQWDISKHKTYSKKHIYDDLKKRIEELEKN